MGTVGANGTWNLAPKGAGAGLFGSAEPGGRVGGRHCELPEPVLALGLRLWLVGVLSG